MTDSNNAARDYRETLFLPKTDFPMRASLPKREPDWIARWNDINLYKKQREAENAKGPYTLHDGPPYANGHIHMGTTLNKMLKDIVNRSHQMLGHDANYVPGWDCHGLPIEWKVEEEFRSKGRLKDDVPGAEFRTRCREYAAEWLDIQRSEFKRLGVIGDWDNPYKTMNFQSEAAICGELLKIAGTGQLPWSKPGDKLIVADDLWETVSKAGLVAKANRIMEVPHRLLVGMHCDHPLKDMHDAEGKYDFPVPLLNGSHVTSDAGTGFVHTAPSHGEDDYVVWISNQKMLEEIGIDPVVPMTLDDTGCYTDVMPTRFQGLDVIRTSGKKRGQDGKANPEVLKALVECGNLLARGILMLRDAHSWRSKAPVIRRATPQWFISMSKDGLREKALKAIEETTFWPDRGRNRIGAMVSDRPDWLISRQRNWGVPITLIVGPNGELHTERDDA